MDEEVTNGREKRLINAFEDVPVASIIDGNLVDA